MYDTVIAGGGPAGASAAAFLSRAGLRVLVLERKPLPRMKLCAGGLSPEAYGFVLRHFGAIPKDAFSEPRSWTGLRVHLGGDHGPDRFLEMNRHARGEGSSTARGEIPEAMSCVRRERFDAWLLSQSDVQVWEQAKLLAFRQTPNGKVLVSVRDKKNGKLTEIPCSFLLGADGAWSRTRRILEPDLDTRVGWFTVHEEWHAGSIDLAPDWYYMFLGRPFVDLFCSFFAKDDSLVFSTVSRRGLPVRARFQAFLEFLGREYGLESAEIRRKWGCLLNNMGATDTFCFGAGRVLLLGEAAGFVGFCGEGISGALISGKLAADAILESGGEPRATLEGYIAASLPLRQRIHEEHEAGRAFPGTAYARYAEAPTSNGDRGRR